MIIWITRNTYNNESEIYVVGGGLVLSLLSTLAELALAVSAGTFRFGTPGDGIHREAADVSSGRYTSSGPSRNAIMNMKKNIIASVNTTCAAQWAHVIVKLGHGLSPIVLAASEFFIGGGAVYDEYHVASICPHREKKRVFTAGPSRAGRVGMAR
jgi:hypothetical protein